MSNKERQQKKEIDPAYIGWLPTVLGNLSFSLVGHSGYPFPLDSIFHVKSDGSIHIICLQKRIARDYLFSLPVFTERFNLKIHAWFAPYEISVFGKHKEYIESCYLLIAEGFVDKECNTVQEIDGKLYRVLLPDFKIQRKFYDELEELIKLIRNDVDFISKGKRTEEKFGLFLRLKKLFQRDSVSDISQKDETKTDEEKDKEISSLIGRFEKTIKVRIEKAEELCFSKKKDKKAKSQVSFEFRLDRQGICQLGLPEIYKLSSTNESNKNNSGKKCATKTDENLIEQAFFFIKDAFHSHKHHDRAEDTLIKPHLKTKTLSQTKTDGTNVKVYWFDCIIKHLYYTLIHRRESLPRTALGIFDYIDTFTKIAKKWHRRELYGDVVSEEDVKKADGRFDRETIIGRTIGLKELKSSMDISLKYKEDKQKYTIWNLGFTLVIVNFLAKKEYLDPSFIKSVLSLGTWVLLPLVVVIMSGIIILVGSIYPTQIKKTFLNNVVTSAIAFFKGKKEFLSGLLGAIVLCIMLTMGIGYFIANLSLNDELVELGYAVYPITFHNALNLAFEWIGIVINQK